MSNIVVLNSQAHRELRVHAKPSARFGDAQRFVPVVVGEFALLAVSYPIFFSKDAETGAFYVGAMLGFDEGENLFLEEGKGFEGYRPLNLQRAPFFATGEELAIDLDSARIATEGGERLFDDQGAASTYLESIMTTFQNLKPGSEKTKTFIARLMELRMIEPIRIDLAFDDGTRRIVEDLYTINQTALRDLPDDVVVDLFRRDYMRLIYLMIASLRQVPILARRKNQRLLEN